MHLQGLQGGREQVAVAESDRAQREPLQLLLRAVPEAPLLHRALPLLETLSTVQLLQTQFKQTRVSSTVNDSRVRLIAVAVGAMSTVEYGRVPLLWRLFHHPILDCEWCRVCG